MEIVKNFKTPVNSIKEWEKFSDVRLKVTVKPVNYDDGTLEFTIEQRSFSEETYPDNYWKDVIGGYGGHPEIVDTLTSVIENINSNCKFTKEFYNDVEKKVASMFEKN